MDSLENVKLLDIDILLIQDKGHIKSTSHYTQNGYTMILGDSPPEGDKNGRLAILHKSSLNAFIINLKAPAIPIAFEIDNRLMMIEVTFPIQTYIINTYAQENNHQNINLIKSIHLLIIGGDLNSYENPDLDTHSSRCSP